MTTTALLTDSELSQGSLAAAKLTFAEDSTRFSIELNVVAPAGVVTDMFRSFGFSFAQSVQDITANAAAKSTLYGLTKDCEIQIDSLPTQNFQYCCEVKAPYLYVFLDGSLEADGYEVTVSTTELAD